MRGSSPRMTTQLKWKMLLEALTGYRNSRVVPLYLIVQQPHSGSLPSRVPGKAERCKGATHGFTLGLVEHPDRNLLLSSVTRVHGRAPVGLRARQRPRAPEYLISGRGRQLRQPPGLR